MGHFLDRAGKPFFAQEQDDSVVGAPGRAPDRPASFCGKKDRGSGWNSYPADPFWA
jgi:hypothetical protein